MTIPSPDPAELEWEIWLPPPNWPGYFVSDLGRVVSMKNPRRPRIKAVQVTGRDGREVVFLHDGRQHSVPVHRLVGEAFLGPLPDGMETRHLDGNPTNNRLVNLRYGTHLENEEDKRQHGTHHLAHRTHCRHGHPFSGPNLRVDRRSGARICRTCKKAQMRAFYERRAAVGLCLSGSA